ncbi:MAG: AI-2E family transporter, partial [Rhodococcus sp.]|nr:AI-2E family transporter [Rhodococcus sp. (in: high G+C Gram-positive bacteria)]
FFFIKDGPRFIPWVNQISGRNAGKHISTVLVRMWDTLGGFIRTQALVSLIDAVFIGAGLLILGVPLAPVLAILTFIGGFIPFIGAFVAGALAVMVALVANGFTTAVIVLGLILAVQQIEGNVLQPILQSRSMKLHAVVVLLSVTAGGSVFGIVGAFLAVPTAAVAAVLFRYLSEQIDERSADSLPDADAAEAARAEDDETDSAGDELESRSGSSPDHV